MDAARAIWTQIAEVRTAGVGLHELERARRIFEARWIRRLESMEGQANFLAEWQAAGDWHMGLQYLEQVLALRAADIVAVARRYLRVERAAVLAYRPRGAPPIARDAAELRAWVENA